MKIKTAYPSSSGPNLCYNHVNHCCFPGAIWSQQSKDLPIINGKRGVSDSCLYFVFLAFLTAFTLTFIFLKFFPQVFSYCNRFLRIQIKFTYKSMENRYQFCILKNINSDTKKPGLSVIYILKFTYVRKKPYMY